MADILETAQMCVKTDILRDTNWKIIAYSYHMYQYDIVPSVLNNICGHSSILRQYLVLPSLPDLIKRQQRFEYSGLHPFQGQPCLVRGPVKYDQILKMYGLQSLLEPKGIFLKSL